MTEGAGLTGPTADLLDLLQASALSYLEVLETLGETVDGLEGNAEPPALPVLSALLRSLAEVRKHVVRLTVVAAQIDGPYGARFPGLAGHTSAVAGEVDHLELLSSGLAQAARDLVALRTAVESNRLAESANELGRVSNRIAALANTSNLRMLGVAYIALLLGLISAVVLIPNTAATILGMPSAGWVPGLWVDVVLVVLAIVPIAVVFSRPWVRRMLHGWRTYEDRSAEGLGDLPEVRAQDVNAGPAAERLIRESP